MSALMARILDILSEGRRSLSVPDASEWKALALTRWQMMQALGKFIDYKERYILSPLSTSADPIKAAEAARLMKDNDKLATAYKSFVERWALTSASTVDSQYKSDALAMANQIERQVISDVQELESLLLA